MSQDDSSSTDSADLCQSFFSLNLNQSSDLLNLNATNLDSNPSAQETIELTDRNQTIYFHPPCFHLNKHSQSKIALNNLIDFNYGSLTDEDSPIVPSIDQNKSQNPLNKPSFDWDSYLDRNQILKKLRKDKRFVDVQLIADDGHSEYVHSTFISSLGKEFTDFIFSLKENPNTSCTLVDDCENNPNHIKQIKLTGIDGPALKVIVDSVYSGYLETDDKKIIWSIINLADHFGLTDILKACCTHLIYHLNIDNCVKLLHLGIKLKHKLRTAAWNFIRLKFDRIVNECSDYIHLTIDELVSLLDDDHLNTVSGEQIVWQGICRWILADLINRTKHLNRLLGKLRFGRLPLGYLEDVIVKEPLLIEIQNGLFNESDNRSNDNGDFVNEIKLNCKSKPDKKSDKNQNVKFLKFNDTDNSKCLNLVNQMVTIRKNKENQFKTDNFNFLIDLSPYYVKPRIPAEVIFVIGGWQDNMITTLIETYDSRTNMWFESYIALKYRAYHRIEVLNGLLYIIGGTNGAETLSTMHCFNPNSDRWYEKANMHERRCYVSTTIVNDLIYAMGGHNGAMRLNSVERYDYKTNQWSTVCPMNLVRSDASAVAYENKIYIAGGLNEHVQNTVEFYNPEDNTWTFIEPMYFNRNSLSLILYGGYLFALGGSNGVNRLNSVEKYDFNTGNWSLAKPMRCSRSTFSACILEDKLYVVGGHNHHTQIKSVEYYDLQTDKWYEVKSLKKTRSGFAICTYKSFRLSRKFTYTHHAEQCLIKSKKNHIKKKMSNKSNEQSNSQSNNQNHNHQNNHRSSLPPKDNSTLNMNQFFNSTNLNRFRIRRTQMRPNLSFSNQPNTFGTRSLLELNTETQANTRRVQSSSFLNLNANNGSLSVENNNEISRENDQFNRGANQQIPSLENSSANNDQNIQANIETANDRASSSNRNLVVGPDSSSSNIQLPTIRVKSYPSMTRRFFQTRSLNNDRIVDRESSDRERD